MPESHLELARAVLPIVKMGTDGSYRALLGTAFIVGQPTHVVTAAHVFEDNPLAADEWYAACHFRTRDDKLLVRLEPVRPDPRFDIAICHAPALADRAVSLALYAGKIGLNEDVIAMEYSHTVPKERPGKLRGAHFSPLGHKGNVLRYYTSDFPESHPTPVLDTSFPALQGASGAPVLRGYDFSVVGMLVANHERHLLPAQVVRVEMGEQRIEEVSYFLPTGKAITSEVLLQVFDRAGLEVKRQVFTAWNG